MGAAELAFIVKAIDGASGPLRGIGGELDKTEGKLSKIGGLMKGAFAVGAGVAVAGIGALGVVLKQSMDAASEAEQVSAQLDAVLKSTGGSAGVSRQAIEDHALALSQMTRFEDDAIVSADALLLTFTNIGKDVFPKATDITLDLATAFKMDLKSAAIMVGKALNDPKKGLTALSRAGVQFSEDQKKVIESMVATGDIAGAQTLILKELEIQIGGSAKAAGETAAGQMDIFKNAIGNVKEEIGFALLPILKDLATWAGPKLVEGFQKFSSWIKTGLGDIEQLAGKFGKAKNIIGGIIDDVVAGKKINWQDLMNLSGLFTNELDIQRAFGRIVKQIETAITNIKTAYEEGGLKGVFELIWKSIGDFWTNNAVPFAQETGNKIKGWWDNTLLPWLRENAPTWAEIGVAMQGAWNSLKTFWETQAVPFAQEVANAIGVWWQTKVMPFLLTKAPEWGESLNKMLKSVVTIGAFKIGDDANLAYTLGAGFTKLLVASLKPLMMGPQLVIDALKAAFAGGIGNKADWGDVFGDIFGGIKDFLSGALDAFLMEMGADFVAKISDWWNGILNSIRNLVGGGAPSTSGPTGGVLGPNRSATRGVSTRAAGGGMFNVTININGGGGNPQAIGKAARDGVLSAARSLGYA